MICANPTPIASLPPTGVRRSKRGTRSGPFCVENPAITPHCPRDKVPGFRAAEPGYPLSLEVRPLQSHRAPPHVPLSPALSPGLCSILKLHLPLPGWLSPLQTPAHCREEAAPPHLVHLFSFLWTLSSVLLLLGVLALLPSVPCASVCAGLLCSVDPDFCEITKLR